uniref:Protein XRI1 n=1 Tax=Rhizophora mucronata TaxID=61149 RepID=A0A2P2KKR3_RHIMU
MLEVQHLQSSPPHQLNFEMQMASLHGKGGNLILDCQTVTSGAALTEKSSPFFCLVSCSCYLKSTLSNRMHQLANCAYY